MDKQTIYKEICKEYRATHRKSESRFKKNQHSLIKGGSHNLRLFDPFPFYDTISSGSKVQDIDGHTYIDFWQGHFANVLGHNPKIVIQTLRDYFNQGQGLETGFPGLHQIDLSELILKQVKANKIRFTTSGTLATMYSIMLALSFTQRNLVLKIGGGWHGAQPYALKGITIYQKGLELLESTGLPSTMDSSILITQFNNIQDLEEKFKEFGDRTACLILEPFIGAGGFIFGNQDYIRKARTLTEEYGSVLIFDEVISGFRFLPSGLQSLYEVEPDLSVFGKAIGGGLPVSAVTGHEDIMNLCSPETPIGSRVKFDGGTFSAHPAAILAGIVYLRHLIKQADAIYPKIGKFGQKVRQEIEKIFAENGFNVKCTGKPFEFESDSSFVGVHFLKKDVDRIVFPEQVWDPQTCDIEMREKIFKLAMLNEGVNIFHGFGAVSAAHTDQDIQFSLDAVERIAKKWRTKGLEIE